MSKKTLEEKIKDIIFYAIIFCALYLIIGFLIKSEWLTNYSESWNYSYELIRDALTLTAYFLAPAIAFMLFSDWRKEHREKKQEEMSENIIKNLTQAYNSSYMINIIIDDESSYVDVQNIKRISEQFKKISQFLSEAKESLGILERRLAPETHGFIKVSKKLLYDDFSMWVANLLEMFKLQEKYNGVPPHEIQCEYDQYDEYCTVVAGLVWSAIKELKVYQKEILI